MVTEQPQYSVDVCIFQTLQNTEISLIPNGLRFIFTYLLLLTFAITFHLARHTNATLLIYKGANITTVQKLLGHKNLATTQIYGEVMGSTIIRDLKKCQKR